MPLTGRQRRLIQCFPVQAGSLNPELLVRRAGRRPAVLPNSEGPRGRPRRTRNAGRARRRHATAASNKAADGPLPACWHLQHRRPVARSRRGAGTARRQGGRRRGRRAGSVR